MASSIESVRWRSLVAYPSVTLCSPPYPYARTVLHGRTGGGIPLYARRAPNGAGCITE